MAKALTAPMIHRKFGFYIGNKPQDDAAFAHYAEAGLSALEFSFSYEKYEDYDFKAGANRARANGLIPWSGHLPFYPFKNNNIASLDPEVRKNTIALQSALLCRFGEAGIPLAVIHPSGEPNAPEVRDEMIKYAKESLAILAEVAAREGVTIAVEDLPRTCLGNTAAEIADLLTADDRLRVGFDTNHLLIDDNLHFMRELKDKIVTVHVSDYDFIDEKHWLPGEGKVDWVAFMDTLDEIGYDGVFMYEIGFEAPKTILRPRDLTVEDFVRNARELEARAPLTVIGKPNV